jgi:hypothetical protein
VTARLTRTYAWLNWRILVNGLRAGRQRDAAERLSRIADIALPALLVVVGIPISLALAVLGAFAGWWLAHGGDAAEAVVTGASLGLLVPLFWFVMRPLTLAERGQLGRSDLLRLLPIPGSFLLRAELLRTAFDPLFLLAVPPLLFLPLGAGLAGRPLLAVVTLACGLAFLAFLGGFAAVLNLAAQLLMRNRTRAELVTLVFFLALSVMGLLPQLMIHDQRDHGHAGSAAAVADGRTGRHAGDRTPAPAGQEIPKALRFLPPAAYGMALQHASARQWPGVAINFAGLAALALLVYGASARLHRRLLETPERASAGRGSSSLRVRALRVPGLSAEAAAVGWAQLRTVMRTVRGKMLLASPALTMALFTLVFTRGGHDHPEFFRQPYALVGIAVLIATTSLAAVVANQFAVEGGALVLQFLQPVSDEDLVFGKAFGSGVLLLGATCAALLPLALLLPSAPLPLLLSALAAALAAHALLAPFSAVLSALLPRTADLGRLHRGGQPHAGATLLHLAATPVAFAPAVIIVALTLRVFAMPWLAPLLVLAWGACCVLLCRGMVPLAARVLAARRENLAMVAMGR